MMTLNGPVTNMTMDIDGGPSKSIADSNHIGLLTGNSIENSGIDYIDFEQFGSK